MSQIWDSKADAVKKGDNLRNVTPIEEKTRVDENGFTHYIFSKTMITNPYYVILSNDVELFEKFIKGGSRQYPSDGSIPVDIVAAETRLVLNEIEKISKDPNSLFHQNAIDVLKTVNTLS